MPAPTIPTCIPPRCASPSPRELYGTASGHPVSSAQGGVDVGTIYQSVCRTDRLLNSGPIRTSVVVIDNDITMMQQNAGLPKRRRGELTKLEQVLAKGGGAYKSTGYDSAFFRVYSNATFSPVKAERRDLTVGLELDAPSNGDARNKDAKKRQAYWEHSRLLQSGSLVVLVIILNGNLRVHLGTISSYGKDIAESSKASKERIQVRISFFDPEVELMALQMQRKKATGSTMFLLDNDVMYEASRPFLEQLQTVEPTEIPFARYIAHSGPLENILILPPKYTTAPRFSFKLSSLAKKGVNAQQVRDLNMRQPGAVELARKQLLEYSELDPSQVEAVINTITRELSLIQGYVLHTLASRELLLILFFVAHLVQERFVKPNISLPDNY